LSSRGSLDESGASLSDLGRRLRSDDSHELKGRRLRVIGAGLAAASIFLIDVFTMLHSGVAVLYVIVLVIADDGASDRRVCQLAAMSAGLATLGFLLNQGTGTPIESTLRWIISLAAIAVTALLLQRNRRVQQAARRNDLRYRTIFDTIAVAIWEHDFSEVAGGIKALRAGGVVDLRSYLVGHPQVVVEMRRTVRITDANDTALRLLQVPSKQHFFSHLSDFLPEEDDSFLECILAIDEGKAIFETETQMRTISGDKVDVFVNLSFSDTGDGLARVCGSIMDVTERKRIQSVLERTRVELDQAIRGATVGELSASIAHEVSQPIGAVRAFIEAARRWLARTPPDVAEALAAIHEAARAAVNAGEVVDRVRKLVSRATPEQAPVDLAAVIRSAVDVAQRQLAGTTLELDLDAAQCQVLGDPILLQHLMLNILNNAVEAMDRSAAADRRMQIRLAKTGESILLEVSDNGPAFSAEATRRAFSTREGGVGVGLAMCRSIVEAHGGTITIGRSGALTGASIEIRLPVLAGRVPQA
jgi:two-component system sensor kinase FixL